MKRVHIGMNVEDIGRSVRFYTDLFGAAPTVEKSDYAKWMLEDPRLNFSITARCGSVPGDVHFGIQVDSESELGEVAERLEHAGREVLPESDAHCCYHHSEKAWVLDPDKQRWETFFSHGEIEQFGECNAELEAIAEEAKCCP
jgi:catechol 2,3-dioxygenase-like lactoylglutathione lyase family enzyme